MNNLIDVKSLRPFKKFIMSIGEIPSAYSDSMSYYELLNWFCDYLQNQVIPTINNNANAVTELQNLYIELKSYVDNYFNNLDVQEEINNKLDDMVESGQMEELILNVINGNLVQVVNNVQQLKSSNAEDGQTIKTLGYYNINDGGDATYIIRNNMPSTYYETLNNGKYAELIVNNSLNILQIGAIGDETTDNTTQFNYALNNFKSVCIPDKSFLINGKVEVTNSDLHLYGLSKNSKIIIHNDNTISSQVINGHGLHFEDVSNITIDTLIFTDNTENKSRFSYNIRFIDCDNININNIEVIDNCGPGLFFLNTTHGNISNSYIHNTYADGIHIQRGSKQFNITNCKFHNTHDDCIGFVSHEGETYGQCQGLVVQNCQMLNTLITGSGLCCDGSKDVIISNCIISDTILAGIRLNRFKESSENTWFYPSNIKILNNTFDNCGTIVSDNRNTINGNQSGSTDVIGNTIRNANALAIFFTGSLGIFNIKNNTITDSVNGISVTCQTDVAFDNKFIVNISGNILTNISGIYPIISTDNNTSIVNDDNIIVNVVDNTLNKLNTQNLGGYVFTLNSIRRLKIINNIVTNYNEMGLYSISNSTHNLVFRNNIPRNAQQDIPYIGTHPIKYGGSAPTTGVVGDIVINWNPSSGIAFWICITASTPSSDAVYRPVRTDAS